MSAVVGLYCAWLFGNALFVTPFYTAESIYLPLTFGAAYLAVAALPREASVQLLRAGVMLLAALVVLGLLQYFFDLWQPGQIIQRATATFVTPNSFATAVNLFLLPLAALQIAGRGSRRIYGLSLWLFAGLVASESRGGMLASLAGLAFFAACMGLPALWARRKLMLQLLAGWLAVWLAVVAAARLLAPLIRGTDTAGPSTGTWFARATWDRAEIYATTLQLIFERPIAGAGANMFSPLFEAAKSETNAGTLFYFAHNDYLQAWLEYGIVGLALLGALACSVLVYAWRASRRNPGDPLPLAAGAACASCFAHAMVDFPFAIPFVLVILGGYAGAFAAHADRTGRASATAAPAAGAAGQTLSPTIRYALAAAVLAWLAQPMLADIAENSAVRLLTKGEVQRALYWQSVARRLEPRNATHYWAEAVILRDQAVQSGDRALAGDADALFAESARVNPYELAPRIDRIALHRRHRNLLEHAAPPAEVLAWAEQAVKLRPYSVPAQVELARTLAFAGDRERARAVARALLDRHPDLATARRLAAEL